MAGADRAAGIGHVATPADMFVNLLAVGRIERRRVQNTGGTGERRCFDEHRARQYQAHCKGAAQQSRVLCLFAHAAVPAANARWCNRPIASSAEVTAPSCQAGK